MPLSGLERKVCDAISRRQQSLLSDLERHVAIPTGRTYSPGLNEYRQLLLDRLNPLGADVALIDGKPRPEWLELPGGPKLNAPPPPTLILRHRSSEPTPRVLLAGHLDTVHDPHGSFRELTIAPGGRSATGPGVVDMKGGIVIGVHALEILAECGVELNWTFLLNSDEETGSFHSFDAIVAAAREHDIGIALEPALPDGALVVERMGAGQFKVEVFGKSAHVGRDFTTGVSAVAKLGEIIAALAAMSDPNRGIIVNVGPLQGGAATNVVPDYAACWGNVRYADPSKARELEQRIDALATPSHPLPRVSVHHAINRPAKPLIEPVRQLAEAVRDAAGDLNQTLNFGSTGGVCDGNIMQSVGLPTIDTLGVRGGNLHRPDEFIELASLVERCQLLAVVLARMAKRSPLAA